MESSQGIECNCSDKPSVLLRKAVESRNYTFLRSYLTNESNTYPKEDDGYTPLQIALEMDDIEMVRFLLEHKVDPNERFIKGTWGGYTPLQYALINRSTTMVILLIEYKADIFSMSPDMTPSNCVATKYNRVRVIHYLMNNGIGPDTVINETISFLFYALVMGNVKIVKCILKHRPNVHLYQHLQAVLGATLALGNHAKKLVKMLYKYGFTLQPTHFDIPLVQIAVQRGLYDVVLNLLKLGVSPNMEMITDEDLEITGTMLHIAVDVEELKIVQLLLEHGANIHLRNSFGKTPLLIAARRNNLGIIRLLLKYGANVKDADSGHNTVLHCVIGEDMERVYNTFDWNVNKAKTKLVKLLISKGADINAKTCCTSTSPLHMAAQVGVPGAVQMLLSQGARVDEVNFKNLTPLMIAQNEMTSLINNHLEGLPCMELKQYTFWLLKCHILRLHRIGLPICPKDLVESDDEIFKLKDDLSKTIDDEVEFIKETRIGNSFITLQRFLTSTDKEAAGFVRNDVLLKDLKAILYRPNKFPEFAKLIRNKLTVALTKKELDRVTFKLMNFFFQEKELPSLPDECTEYFIKFLSNKDKELVISQFVK